MLLLFQTLLKFLTLLSNNEEFFLNFQAKILFHSTQFIFLFSPPLFINRIFATDRHNLIVIDNRKLYL